MTSGREYPAFRVSARDRDPLLRFMVDALHASGCRILYTPPANEAPFRFVLETPDGDRIGIVAYAFYANQRRTKNRPTDEHRFQVKYGSKDAKLHRLWQDPYGLYTTLFLGINPEMDFFVGADPVLHSPTRMFISIEFKAHHVAEILGKGWTSWERDRRSGDERPIEVLVGGRPEAFLRYVRFEREALGEDQGHRQLLAERTRRVVVTPRSLDVLGRAMAPSAPHLHALAREFQLGEREVMDLIEGAPRLKMAVRGWVAEEHLFRTLVRAVDVTDCRQRREEGSGDISLRFRGSALMVECKNVLRQPTKEGFPRVDFQRTRASKADPCSRYYSPKDFDVVAACLHALTERWEFRYAISHRLVPHPRCKGKLSNNVRVDEQWRSDPGCVFAEAIG